MKDKNLTKLIYVLAGVLVLSSTTITVGGYLVGEPSTTQTPTVGVWDNSIDTESVVNAPVAGAPESTPPSPTPQKSSTPQKSPAAQRTPHRNKSIPSPSPTPRARNPAPTQPTPTPIDTRTTTQSPRG